jgi:threonyl-tRNA synthetase
VVLPVADAQWPAAEALAGQAVQEGLRAVVARPESGSLGARIRAHRLVPYQAVVGAREAAAGEVALRLRDGRRVPARPAGEVLAGIGERVGARSTELWDEAAMPV